MIMLPVIEKINSVAEDNLNSEKRKSRQKHEQKNLPPPLIVKEVCYNNLQKVDTFNTGTQYWHWVREQLI